MRRPDLALCVVLVVCSALLANGFRVTSGLDRITKRRLTVARSSPGSPFQEKRVYEDGPLDRLWLYLFGTKMAAATNTPLDVKNPLAFTYDEFVALSMRLAKGSPTTIKQSVLSVLKSVAFPGFQYLFRTLFPGSSRAACELNAQITPIFFSWLVGPATVEEREVLTSSGEVKTWKSTVLIERCRYLEATQCKGICSSVCKVPTQEFFGGYLGMPVTMTPNFEDLSCEMKFGQPASPISEDSIQEEGCFKECSTGVGQAGRPCPKIPRA